MKMNTEMKMNKEYGGFLPLELNNTGEYYQGDDTVCLNSARYAIVYAYKHGNYRKLYLPFYMCESVKMALDRFEVDYELYHFHNDFEPINVSINVDEAIVYPMFYGCGSVKRMNYIVEKYVNVIFDNTQSFFLPPHKSAYNIYSCRKFFGVSDGAYLVKKGIGRNDRIDLSEFDEDYSSIRAMYLLSAIEHGTNAVYNDSKKSEEDISMSNICHMSKLTRLLLANVDYEYVKDRRRKNYQVIDRWMKRNGFDSRVLNDECVPMVYPFVCKNENVRGELIRNHVYISQWWKYLINDKSITSFELELAKYLLPLPVDQRYDENDIIDMLGILESIMKKEGCL